MDGAAWWAIVHGVAKSRTRLSDFTFFLVKAMVFPGKNTGVSCHFLLQEIFLTQELNPGLPHCRQMLYHLTHQGSKKTLLWNIYGI